MNLYIWHKVVPPSGRAGLCIAVAQTEPHAIAAIERNVGVNPGSPDQAILIGESMLPIATFVHGPKKKKKKRKQANI
jgi:hypothetical protein